MGSLFVMILFRKELFKFSQPIFFLFDRNIDSLKIEVGHLWLLFTVQVKLTFVFWKFLAFWKSFQNQGPIKTVVRPAWGGPSRMNVYRTGLWGNGWEQVLKSHCNPRTQHPPFPLSQAIGGGLSPSIMGAWRRNLRLARGSANSVCLLLRHYLQYAPPKIQPPTHTTPLLAPHFPPTSLPTTQLHLIAISVLAINSLLARTPGLVPTIVKDSATLHNYTNHSINTRTQPTSTRLGKVYKRKLLHKLRLGCSALPPSPRSIRLWDLHRHRTGWHLVGVPFWSTLHTV